MLKFDVETTRILEDAYHGADFSRRRRASFDALSPAPGETILDIGCGNGMLTAELARAVGERGRVIGIDPSAEMLAAGEARCSGLPHVTMQKGAADALGLADASADKAVSIQVFEYVADIPAALAEVRRALRPGGRLVLGDMLFGSLVWSSDDPERMARVLAAYEHHLVDPDTPARLPQLLADAGYTVEAVRPVSFTDHVLRPNGLAAMMLILMELYAVQNGHLPAAEAADWVAEQKQRAAEGRFFFSITHVVVSARKPD